MKLWIINILFATALHLSAGESLLKNPDLSTAREFRAPTGCFYQPAGQKIVRFSYNAEKQLVMRMDSASQAPLMRLGLLGNSSLIAASNGKTAEISCEIRGDIQSETGPVMFIEFRGQFGQGSRNFTVYPKNASGKREKLTGSFDWRKFQFTFDIPAFTDDICVMLQVRNARGWMEWRDPVFRLAGNAEPEAVSIRPFLSAEEALAQSVKKESARIARRRGMYEKIQGPLPAAADLYEVTPLLSGAHPRLLPENLTLDELRRRAADPAYARFYAMIRERAEEAIRRKPLTRSALDTEDPLRGRANQLQYLALAAAIDPDPSERRRFSNETAKLADELIMLGIPKQDLPLAHLSIGLCRAYDLIGTEFDAELRDKIRRFLVELVNYSRDPRRVNFTMWRCDQFTANHNWFNFAHQGVAAMTLWNDPDSPVPQEELKTWLDEAVENFYMVEKTHPEDGFSMEGSMYQDYGLRAYLDFAWPAEKLLKLKYPILDNPYFRNLHARLHLLLPDRTGFAVYSDTRLQELTGYSAFFWAASRFDNPQAQLLGNVMFENDRQRGKPAHASEWRIMESFNSAVTPAKWESLPLCYNGESLGLYSVRSGWEKNDSLMVLRCGTPVGKPCRKNFGITISNGHLAPQQGEVTFFIGSDPVLAPTEYPHTKVTSNHNVSVIEGKSPLQPAWSGQTGEGGSWFEGGRFFMRDTIREPSVSGIRNTADFSTYLCDLGGVYVIHDPQGKPQKQYPDYLRRVVYLPEGAVVIADKLTLPVPRKVKFRLLTVGDQFELAGKDATLRIRDREYRFRDFSPAEHQREITRETLNCDNRRDRKVFNLISESGDKALFAVAAGKPDVVEKLKVEASDTGVAVTLPSGKREFFPWSVK